MLVSFKWWFMTISAKATTVLLVPSHSGPSAKMFPQLNKFNVTLCSTDHLALYLQTQHVDDVLDLVDVAKHLVMADEVPVDHGGTSLKVLSEYSVAREALVQAERLTWVLPILIERAHSSMSSPASL